MNFPFSFCNKSTISRDVLCTCFWLFNAFFFSWMFMCLRFCYNFLLCLLILLLFRLSFYFIFATCSKSRCSVWCVWFLLMLPSFNSFLLLVVVVLLIVVEFSLLFLLSLVYYYVLVMIECLNKTTISRIFIRFNIPMWSKHMQELNETFTVR